MADSVSIQVDAQALLDTLNVARRDFNKNAKVCMNEAAKKCARKVKGKTPAKWKTIVRGVGFVASNGGVYATFGLSKKGQKRKHDDGNGQEEKEDPRFAWFKAYWANYGTYSRRDPGHQYRYARKRKTATWGPAPGYTPDPKHRRHFFENAIAGFESTFTSALTQAIQKRNSLLTKQP